MFKPFHRQNVIYIISSQTDFFLSSINATNYGSKFLRYLAVKIWNILPQDIRSANSLSRFVSIVKSFILDSCSRVLCHISFKQDT